MTTKRPAAPSTGSLSAGLLVSVIVPHLNDLARLAMCIKALESQSLPRDRFEIIVGDNGSACGLAAVRRVAANATVIAVAERGAGPARNAAVAQAKGKIIAFTDSDCLPARDWLEQGIAALSSADLAGGAVEVSVRAAGLPSGAEAFEQVFAFDNRRYVVERGFSVTANLMAKRAVVEAIGGFRVGVPEDLDWCRRAVAAGFHLAWAPEARVTHPARADFDELRRKWRRLTDEAFGDWQHQGLGRLAWMARAFGVLGSPFVHAGRVLTSAKISGSRTRLAALGTLVAIRWLRAAWMMQQALAVADQARPDLIRQRTPATPKTTP